jgi:signal transduction histidine kinase
LTSVQGYIELIAQYDDTLPPEQRREFLHRAQLGCEELTVLLRNVMDASRLEAEAALKPALINSVSVKNILDKVMMMIEPQITRDQREVIVNVPANIFVWADPLRLHQVLMNISTNALKYSLAGTPITFCAERSTEMENAVVISISDNGKGISSQDQARLFQRFYRLESDMNSPVRGSGLGLYISRRLVDAMGGKIWIESRGVPGEGSTFHIQLPMA